MKKIIRGVDYSKLPSPCYSLAEYRKLWMDGKRAYVPNTWVPPGLLLFHNLIPHGPHWLVTPTDCLFDLMGIPRPSDEEKEGMDMGAQE
jgi:hypothetical protein